MPNIPESGDRISVGIKKAARMVGVSDRTVAKWLKQGVLRGVKIGGRVLIPVSELKALLEQQG